MSNCSQPLTSCPNCGVMWGIEEMDAEYCGCCGYPDCDDDDWDDDSDDLDDCPNI